MLRSDHLMDVPTKAGSNGAGKDPVKGAQDSDGAEIVKAVKGARPFVDQGNERCIEIAKETTGGAGVKESFLDEECQRVRKGGLIRVISGGRLRGELPPELVRDPVNPREGTTGERGDSRRDVLDSEDALRGERL